jgi:HAD superfamily hydrolase (TIGR01490 family)
VELAIFDLDNTLLDGDSDYCWGCFLADKGIVDGEQYRSENQRYYEEYKAGTLDIHEFLEFSLHPLSQHALSDLLQWRDEFLRSHIEPLVLPKALDLIDWHRRRDHELLIITATNRFITEPIAQRLGIPNLLATDPELAAGRYTGKVAGIPCFREGKISRYRQWLAQEDKMPERTWFYSDSHNDIPLLELVTTPVIVDADEKLIAHAQVKGWRHISLRGPADTGPNREQVLLR